MKPKIILLLIITLAAFLRLYKLGEIPIGLYSDEAAYGYNAYSLLTTGRDEYGKFWPLTFKNFGDYKPPMTAWLTLPAIAIFGLNEFAIRLPSALTGIATVIIVYLLAREIFPKSRLCSYAAALLLAISPWHLLFSRSSMLVGIEAMFISLGLLLFLKSLARPPFLYLSAASFTAAIYTYYGSRITVPLLLIGLVAIFRRQLWRIKFTVLASAILGLSLLSPLFVAIIRDPATLTGRARTVSVFYQPGVIGQLWQAHTLDGPDYSAWWSRFFHNKGYYYFREIARRYFQHLSYDFWIRTGDTHPPFDIPNMGLLYLLDIPFVFYGVYLAFRHRTPQTLALLGYLFISPVVASFTFLTPAANRSFNMVIGWTILTAYGISKLRLKLIAYSLVAVGYLGLFIFFLYQALMVLPLEMPHKWHYGRRELMAKVATLEDKFDRIVFSPNEGPAYIWLLFYNKYSPTQYWQTAVIDENFDELGWLHVTSFDKYIFPKSFDWDAIDKQPSALYIGYEQQLPDQWQGRINGRSYQLVIDDRVTYPNGQPAFKLGHLQ